MAQRAFAPTLLVTLVVLLALLASPGAPLAAGPEGQLTWAVHVSLAPTWFDPAETPGMITPYMVLYALHDALVKPMPGQPRAPSLAESWSVSKDGLRLRVRAAQGRALPQRRSGHRRGREVLASSAIAAPPSKTLKERVAAVETPGPEPRALPAQAALARLPDLLHRRHRRGLDRAARSTWRRSATRASRRRRSAPGPTSSSPSRRASSWSWRPSSSYWRKPPSVKRLVLQGDPRRVDPAGRAQARRGRHRRTRSAASWPRSCSGPPGLTLKPAVIQAPFWLYFPDQWDPKSPWHDRRVRLAASLAIDRPAINQALTLGYSRLTGSIIPDHRSSSTGSRPRPSTIPPARPRSSWPRPGYPNGFDAGEYYLRHLLREPAARRSLNYLQTVGIRAKLRPLRARGVLQRLRGQEVQEHRPGRRAARSATRPRASRPSWSPAAPTSTAATPTSTALFKEQAAELGPQAARGHAARASSSSCTRR